MDSGATQVRGDETAEEVRARLDEIDGQPDDDESVVDIVTRVERFIRQYLFAPEAVYLPLSVFFVATHVADVFYSFPYIGVTSPTRGCGKTRVIELGKFFCRGALLITASSVAALFRMVNDGQTLLWDECESFRNKHRSESTDLIIQILNVGYKKGATVPRAVGPNHSVVWFPIFGPKIFTAIRDLPDTLADRSIPAHLQKRPKGKKLKRWKLKRVVSEAAPIKVAIEEWAPCLQGGGNSGGIDQIGGFGVFRGSRRRDMVPAFRGLFFGRARSRRGTQKLCPGTCREKSGSGGGGSVVAQTAGRRARA